MNRLLRQIGVVIKLNLETIPQRLWLSTATVIAVAFVVAVLLGFLAMAEGFKKTLEGSGSEDVAIVMRAGAEAELNSVITREQQQLISEAPGVARDAEGPIASEELYVVVDALKRSSNTEVNIPLRGVGARAAELRGGLEIVDGRMFAEGTNEIIVGQAVQREFTGFELGREVRFGTTTWTVVGVFAIPGTAFESELWADRAVIQTLFNRGAGVQTMRVKLEGPDALDRLRAYLDEDPRLQLDARTEKDFYAGQSGQLTTLINILGWPLSVLMAIGALMGALNTMYSSVEARMRDTITMRIIGFNGLPAFFGVLAESLALAAIGGLIGSVVAYVAFNGFTASTLGGGFTQVVFSLSVSPQTIVNGVVLALIIGFVGGFFPAIRAARLPLLGMPSA